MQITGSKGIVVGNAGKLVRLSIIAIHRLSWADLWIDLFVDDALSHVWKQSAVCRRVYVQEAVVVAR